MSSHQAVAATANRLKLSIQQGLSSIAGYNGQEAEKREAAVRKELTELFGYCEKLQRLMRQEPPSERGHLKLKADQLKFDADELQLALAASIKKREQKEKLDRDREELLSRNFNSERTETSLLIDAALGENEQLKSSNRGILELIGNAKDILRGIGEQDDMLKSTKRKMLNIGNTLGLSNSVMRLIEQRTAQDKVIFWVGVILTLIIMATIYHYFG